MILQLDRTLSMETVFRQPYVRCMTGDHRIVLDHHAIVDDRNPGRRKNRAIVAEPGRGEQDVVFIPFTRRTHHIFERRGLLVNASRLAIGISAVVIIIQHLQLVTALQENATVAPCLVLSGNVGRDQPFDMELEILEGLFRLYIPGAFFYRHHTIPHFPFRR